MTKYLLNMLFKLKLGTLIDNCKEPCKLELVFKSSEEQ